MSGKYIVKGERILRDIKDPSDSRRQENVKLCRSFLITGKYICNGTFRIWQDLDKPLKKMHHVTVKILEKFLS